MWNRKNTQVLVAGAGPVGMIAGICLFKNEIDFEIVDRGSGPSTHSKACLLSPDTIEFLDDLDLLDDVQDKGLQIKNIQLYAGNERIANLELSDLPNRFPYIISVPQFELEIVLLERLKTFHKHVRWNHRISSLNQKDGEQSIEADQLGEHMTGYAVMHEEQFVKKTLTFKSKVVLAADGFYSLIRRLQEIEYVPVGDSMSSLLFETKRTPLEDPILKLGFTREGTASYVPLPHGIGRYGFTTGPIKDVSADRGGDHDIYSEDIDKMPGLSDSDFAVLLQDRLPSLSKNPREILWRASVPFGARLADQLWNHGSFLLGDAARSGFPIGAKSLNLALPEVGKVVKALKDYLNNNSDSDLKELDEAIREDWVELALLTYNPAKDGERIQESKKDLGQILQALPLTGNALTHVASKLLKLIESHPPIREKAST